MNLTTPILLYVLVGADADHDGNDIPTTYLKKADAKTMFNTGYRQVSSNEFDKYFSDTWSYAGADGLSIDSGTWLVNYYCWVSESSAVDVISLKSTVDQAIGITAPNNGNGGTWLTMHEIISGKAVNNLKFLIKSAKSGDVRADQYKDNCYKTVLNIKYIKRRP